MNYNEFMREISLFLNKLKKDEIDLEKKQKLYDIVINMEQCTEIKKRRFILYYNLKNDNEKRMSFDGIGKNENCTGNAVKQAVLKITCRLAKLKGESRECLLDILKN